MPPRPAQVFPRPQHDGGHLTVLKALLNPYGKAVVGSTSPRFYKSGPL
ncbi:hypothetical protein AAFN85_02975 [Mucilaginibacter sp. CAU 1740]